MELNLSAAVDVISGTTDDGARPGEVNSTTEVAEETGVGDMAGVVLGMATATMELH